jgi:hypothetical protein
MRGDAAAASPSSCPTLKRVTSKMRRGAALPQMVALRRPTVYAAVLHRVHRPYRASSPVRRGLGPSYPSGCRPGYPQARRSVEPMLTR